MFYKEVSTKASTSSPVLTHSVAVQGSDPFSQPTQGEHSDSLHSPTTLSVAVESLLKQNNNTNMLPPLPAAEDLKREMGSFVGSTVSLLLMRMTVNQHWFEVRVRYFYVE